MQNSSSTQLDNILKLLQSDSSYDQNITCWQESDEKPPELINFPAYLHPSLIQNLKENGISALYSHQVDALNHIQNGQDVVLSTGTSSGKSLCYQLPIINDILSHPDRTALLFFPTKALANDQLGSFYRLIKENLRNECRFSVYDGDTTQTLRRTIRERSNIILTNPDMLSLGILPNHTLWAGFFEKLKYVVIDEIHVYRGVFGSHVSNLIRRLRRICHFYGSDPIFIMTSATIHNPLELSQKLIERKVNLIENDGSPKGVRTFLIYNPPLINEELGVREGLLASSGKFISLLYSRNIQTLVFCRTRKFVEILKREIKNTLQIPDARIRGYRSGYLRAERREIEEGLKNGSVMVGIATNALELGVDIGGVDAVILPGYPGTIAALKQRAGRAGRKFNPSLAVFIASMNPLDQYLARNPQYLLSRNPEEALINPNNPLILLQHLQCAVAELPFEVGEGFGNVEVEQAREYLDYLVEQGILFEQNGKYNWVSNDYPSQHVSLRSTASDTILLETDDDGKRRVIGEVDYNSGLWMVHPGATYIHDGYTYQVDNLDLNKNIALLSPSNDDYITEPEVSADVEIVKVRETLMRRNYSILGGDIIVNTQVKGYKRILWSSRQVMDFFELEMPRTSLHTTGYWVVINDSCVEKMRSAGKWKSDKNYYGPDWESVRSQVRHRDHYICQVCGISEVNGEHHVHHKIPFKMFDNTAMANSLTNLVTLCQNCHAVVENQVRIRSALSGLKYILENLSPLLVMCDSGDLTGFADPAAKFAENRPAIIFYDNIPAGIGLTDSLYTRFEELLDQAGLLITSCSCSDGCPSCVGPSAENMIGGKSETLELVHLLLEKD